MTTERRADVAVATEPRRAPSVKHKHHIVPRCAGGDNSELNVTPPISIRLHAMFHLDRWRHVGDIRDLVACRTLLGRLTTEEARIAVCRARLKGRKFSAETIAMMSASQRRRAFERRMPKMSVERRQVQSDRRKGRPEFMAACHAVVAEANRRRAWSDESRRKSSESHRRFYAAKRASHDR